MEAKELSYLRALSRQFPNKRAVLTEIINLKSILALPKGTDHFLSDLHGEFEQFSHVLRNGSGAIKRKIREEFGLELSTAEINTFATIIYYPREKIKLVLEEVDNHDEFYKDLLLKLIRLTKRVSSKYTKSHVRKKLPKEFGYVIEELITEKMEIINKTLYYDTILDSIISNKMAFDFAYELANLIKKLTIARLHIAGDIFDRGDGAYKIIDTLKCYHSVSIAYGNHDVLYMAAGLGHYNAIAQVLKNAIKHNTLNTIVEDYGINIMPLYQFATNVYQNYTHDRIKITYDHPNYSQDALKKMFVAITLILIKLDEQLNQNRDFGDKKRLLLDKIDYQNQQIEIDGVVYKMDNLDLPTLDQSNPTKLSDQEEQLIKTMSENFKNSTILKEDIDFLYKQGKIYYTHNENLIYHGSVLLNDDATFKKVKINGSEFYGKKLFEEYDKYIRYAKYGRDDEKKAYATDILYSLWNSPNSPLFGKEKMSTFETFFIADKASYVEKKNPYYENLENKLAINNILNDFGMPENGIIISGHVPVSKNFGSPIKCGGKLIFIDGGFSKAYRDVTGIAGYTLVQNSFGLRLVSHNMFKDKIDAIINESDILEDSVKVLDFDERKMIFDTDNGRDLLEKIGVLERLNEAYKNAYIVESE